MYCTSSAHRHSLSAAFFTVITVTVAVVDVVRRLSLQFVRSFVPLFVPLFVRSFVPSFLHSFLSLLLLRSFVLSFLRSPFNALTVTVVLRVAFVHFAVCALPLCCLLFVVHSYVCSVLVLLVIRCRVVDVAVRCGVVTVFAEDTRGMGLVWLCGA